MSVGDPERNPDASIGRIVGRAAQSSPPNRFEQLACERELEQLSEDDLRRELAASKVPTEFYVDESRSLIRKNTSPDVPFGYSLNPYRGCEHGCAYCYARPSHETLGLNAGLDFESKVFVKEQAAQLLRKELNHPGWKCEPITISGITDCYQPAERVYRTTRGCLEVFLESNQPFDIITKNALVVRDLDLLEPAAARNLVHVHMSVTTLDADLCRQLEPRTSTPMARLRAIERLVAANVPVSVMVAPVIPGLTDHEIPAILKASAEAGARSAVWQMLRLPLTVAPVFMDWLKGTLPGQAERVESRIRECRNGELYRSEFHERMTGTGSYAESIDATFRMFAMKLGLGRKLPPLDVTQFKPPKSPGGQQMLF